MGDSGRAGELDLRRRNITTHIIAARNSLFFSFFDLKLRARIYVSMAVSLNLYVGEGDFAVYLSSNKSSINIMIHCLYEFYVNHFI